MRIQSAAGVRFLSVHNRNWCCTPHRPLIAIKSVNSRFVPLREETDRTGLELRKLSGQFRMCIQRRLSWRCLYRVCCIHQLRYHSATYLVFLKDLTSWSSSSFILWHCGMAVFGRPSFQATMQCHLCELAKFLRVALREQTKHLRLLSYSFC